MAQIENSLGENNENSMTQDNIDILKSTYILSSSRAERFQPWSILNNLPTFSINEIQSLWFKIVIKFEDDIIQSPTVYLFKIINKGKGTYGIDGTPFLAEDLLLVSIDSSTITDIIGLETTDVFVIDDLGGLTISEYINQHSPAYNIQPQSDGYTIFQIGTDPDTQVSYLYLGDGGVFGQGQGQTTDADFQLLNSVPESSIQDLDSVLRQGSFAQEEGNIILMDILNTESPTFGFIGSYPSIDRKATMGLQIGGFVSTSQKLSDPVQSTYLNIGGIDDEILKITAGSSVPQFQGVVYNQDFSANYTPRSLVDKEYVDNVAGGGDFVPLGGTEPDEPITGDLELQDFKKIFSNGSNEGYFYFDDGTPLVGFNSEGENYNLAFDTTSVGVNSSDSNFKGFVGSQLFDKQNDPNAYIQGGDLLVNNLTLGANDGQVNFQAYTLNLGGYKFAEGTYLYADELTIKNPNVGTTGVIRGLNINVNRFYDLPDKSGTIALTSDFDQVNLQQVLENGSSSNNIETPIIFQTANNSNVKGRLALDSTGIVLQSQAGGISIEGQTQGTRIGGNGVEIWGNNFISNAGFNQFNTNVYADNNIYFGTNTDTDRGYIRKNSNVGNSKLQVVGGVLFEQGDINITGDFIMTNVDAQIISISGQLQALNQDRVRFDLGNDGNAAVDLSVNQVSITTRDAITNANNIVLNTINNGTLVAPSLTIANINSGVDKTLVTKEYVANNISTKADLVDGVVPSSQLPSYVDDVLMFNNLAAFPTTGEDGKIYVTKDTNKTYRWTGSTYTVVADSISLGETSATAYRGDRGKIAYDHSQLTGNPHNTAIGDITGLQTSLDSKMVNPMTTQYDMIVGGVGGAPTRMASSAINQVLITPGFNAQPTWGKVGLTTHVSGTLPIANGGNGTTTGISAAQATVNSSKANDADVLHKTGNETKTGDLTITGINQASFFRASRPTTSGSSGFQFYTGGVMDWFVGEGALGSTKDFTIYNYENSLVAFQILNSNGNIGINNSDPSEKLHVIGNGKFSGTLSAGSYVFASPQLMIGNDTGYLQIVGLTDNLSTRRFTFESDPSTNGGLNFNMYIGAQLVQRWLENSVSINKPLDVIGNTSVLGRIDNTSAIMSNNGTSSIGFNYFSPTEPGIFVNGEYVLAKAPGAGIIFNAPTTESVIFRTGGSNVTQMRLQPNGNLLVNGDVEITDSTKGIILTAPNASKWRVTVSNTGVLTTTSI